MQSIEAYDLSSWLNIETPAKHTRRCVPFFPCMYPQTKSLATADGGSTTPQEVRHEAPSRHVALHASRQRHEGAGPRGLEGDPHHQAGLDDRHERGRHGRRAVVETHGDLARQAGRVWGGVEGE